MSAVSARSFGPINSTKSSKSTCPPTGDKGGDSGFPATNTRDPCAFLTVHVDLLAQLDQLHLRRHVSHSSHAVPQIFAADESIFVFVKLLECVSQLWWTFTQSDIQTHVQQTSVKLSLIFHLTGIIIIKDIRHKLTVHFLWTQLSVLFRSRKRFLYLSHVIWCHGC